jgi:predicted GNAT superfamily acetyltransferase
VASCQTSTASRSNLANVDQVFAAADVLAEVWGGDRGGMPPNLLRALAHSGNYAVGLYDGDRMIGASVAFFAAPGERSMHSHITGILDGYRSQGLGRLLKQHQRAWAFARDVGHITGRSTRWWRATRTSTSSCWARASRSTSSTSTAR